MKVLKVILKVLAVLAAVAGVVYVVATYGDKIVAWAKKLLKRGEKAAVEGECDCDCDCACECECECAEEAAEDSAVVAEEKDFEG